MLFDAFNFFGLFSWLVYSRFLFFFADHQMWTGMNPRSLVLGAAMIMAVILVVLILLLTAVWCYKKSHPLDMSQMHPDWSGHNKYTLGGLSHVPPMGAPYCEGEFVAEHPCI